MLAPKPDESLPDEAAAFRKAAPVAGITAHISRELESIGEGTPIAILPEGPMTVTYLENAPIGAWELFANFPLQLENLIDEDPSVV